jgi:hypothetical protein
MSSNVFELFWEWVTEENDYAFFGIAYDRYKLNSVQTIGL